MTRLHCARRPTLTALHQCVGTADVQVVLNRYSTVERDRWRGMLDREAHNTARTSPQSHVNEGE
jgi:hypothetical protein